MNKLNDRERTLARTLPAFTRAEWVEIYNAAPAAIAQKISPHGDSYIENHGVPDSRARSITMGEWHQIYHEIWRKLNPFLYIDRFWRQEMLEILGKLDFAGYCEMCGAALGQPHHDPMAHGRTVTLHRTTCHPDGGMKRVCMLCLAGCRMNWTKKGGKR